MSPRSARESEIASASVSLAPHLAPATEREIEGAIRDLFLRAGWYAAKTDAAMVVRGKGRVARGHLPLGFPDMTFFLGIPRSGLCLAALVEVKTATGKLRDSQEECHQELRDLYGITPHVIRDAAQARTLIAEALRVCAVLKGTR